MEEQEELKAIVQSYIEIRYNALSTSQSDNFRLNRFGDTVSDEADAKVFLDAELIYTRRDGYIPGKNFQFAVESYRS